MRSQLGETFRVLGLTGQVVSRTESSVLVEFGGVGFLSVMANCEGVNEGVITLAAPQSMLAPVGVGEIRRQVCTFFELDPNSSIAIKLCQPVRFAPRTGDPYLAELANSSSQQQGYPDWPSVYAAPPRMPTWYQTGERHPDFKPGEFVRSYLEAEPDEGLYSVPRRYDLSSMFSISVAYALLFSVMRALSAPPSAIFLTGIFFAIVGAAQAIMYGGKKPREASIIAGGVAGFLCIIAFGIVEGMQVRAAVPAAICSILWCPIAGYLAGTIIGGIWLIADYLRQWSESRSESTAASTEAGKSDSTSGDSATQGSHALDD